LQLLKTFVKSRDTKAIRISIEQYNQELQEAEAEYERGEYITHEEFVKQIKKQYNKEIDEAVANVEAGEFYTHDEVVKMSLSFQ